MSGRASREALLRLLDPVVATTGFDLEDVAVTPAGRRRLVRVVVDRDGGVSLDDVADVSRAVSDALDFADALGAAPYVLEVTSPGVDRPLTEQRHWRRARGRLVTAVLADGTSATGRVADVDDAGVTLDQDGVSRLLSWEQVRRGAVQVEFARAAEEAEEAVEGDEAHDAVEASDAGDAQEEGGPWTST